MNDGSTDNSEKIIKKYLKNHPDIQYVCFKNNMGIGNARNKGMEIAKGNYIGFVDSDDWVDSDLFRTMTEKIEAKRSDIAICGIKHEWNNYISSLTKYEYQNDTELTGSYCLRILCREISNNFMISPVVWNKIYRTEFLSRCNLKFLNNSFWEDDMFTFLALLQANTVTSVSGVYYHYYQRPESITHTFTKKHIDDLLYTFCFCQAKNPPDNKRKVPPI